MHLSKVPSKILVSHDGHAMLTSFRHSHVLERFHFGFSLNVHGLSSHLLREEEQLPDAANISIIYFNVLA